MTGRTLCDLGRPNEALDAYADLVARYGDDPSPDLRSQVAFTLFSRCVADTRILTP